MRPTWWTHRAKFVLIGLALCSLATGGALLAFRSHRAPRVSNTAVAPVVHHSERSVDGLVAALVSRTPTYRVPGGPSTTSIASSWYGSPLSLPVIATRDGDLEVRLPTRPNGSTTWIRRASVRLYYTPYRIVVDLGTQRLLLYRSGRLVLNAPAGIGTVADPTPTGHFFVAFFAKAPTPAWGPFVLVTSAHSTSISDWEESGDAIVAIHGPLGESSAIGVTGARVSHGCVRLQNIDLAQLRVVPDGSPVDIIS
jgi:lipoprotein-anchoring transpeptidase ErfK/SrfK